MRSFLYASTVLALFAAGLANVMHETAGLAFSLRALLLERARRSRA